MRAHRSLWRRWRRHAWRQNGVRRRNRAGRYRRGRQRTNASPCGSIGLLGRMRGSSCRCSGWRRAEVRKEKEAGVSARRASPGPQTGSDCAPRSPSTHKGSSRRELLTPVRAPRLECCGPDPPRAAASRRVRGVAVDEVRSAIRAASVGGALESGSSTASCPPKVEARARRRRPRLLPAASVEDPAEGAFAWCVTNSLLGPP